MPHFPAVEKLAANGLLAVETWNNKRAMINFKATIEVPMLGTMIESCGDTLDESHMPLEWPMLIDGAVRQFCMHKRDTIQELNGMLAEFNLQRSSVKINRNTTLWSHNSVWNKKYIDPHPGYTLQQQWDASENYICRKASRSREVTEEAILQMVRELQHLPRASPLITSSYSVWADRNANIFFFAPTPYCSRKVVMQVFTRCVNSAVEADAVISFWFVVHANDMIPR